MNANEIDNRKNEQNKSCEKAMKRKQTCCKKLSIRISTPTSSVSLFRPRWIDIDDCQWFLTLIELDHLLWRIFPHFSRHFWNVQFNLLENTWSKCHLNSHQLFDFLSKVRGWVYERAQNVCSCQPHEFSMIVCFKMQLTGLRKAFEWSYWERVCVSLCKYLKRRK